MLRRAGDPIRPRHSLPALAGNTWRAGIPIHYRGLHLHLRVSGKGVIISMDPRDAGGIDVECHGQVNRLTPGSTVGFVG